MPYEDTYLSPCSVSNLRPIGLDVETLTITATTRISSKSLIKRNKIVELPVRCTINPYSAGTETVKPLPAV